MNKKYMEIIKQDPELFYTFRPDPAVCYVYYKGGKVLDIYENNEIKVNVDTYAPLKPTLLGNTKKDDFKENIANLSSILDKFFTWTFFGEKGMSIMDVIKRQEELYYNNVKYNLKDKLSFDSKCTINEDNVKLVVNLMKELIDNYHKYIRKEPEKQMQVLLMIDQERGKDFKIGKALDTEFKLIDKEKCSKTDRVDCVFVNEVDNKLKLHLVELKFNHTAIADKSSGIIEHIKHISSYLKTKNHNHSQDYIACNLKNKKDDLNLSVDLESVNYKELMSSFQYDIIIGYTNENMRSKIVKTLARLADNIQRAIKMIDCCDVEIYLLKLNEDYTICGDKLENPWK